MASYCSDCGRPKGSPHHIVGICDMVVLDSGAVVHRDRVDHSAGDIKQKIDAGEVRVVRRFITPEMRDRYS